MSIDVDRRVLYGFLGLMLAMNLCVLALLWNRILAGDGDFPVFYSSAQMVREGRASGLYEFDAENAFVHRVNDVTRPPNNHLPYELLIFIPLTYLKFREALFAWAMVSLAMFCAVAFLLARSGAIGLIFPVTLLVTLAFFPVWFSLLIAQDSALVVFVFVIAFLLWRQQRSSLAGFVLAGALFRPQLVLPFVFVTLVAGKGKFVRGFIVGGALMVALSVAVVGFHGMGNYGRILVAQGTEASGDLLRRQWLVEPGKMPTWRGFLWVCGSTWMPTAVKRILLLAGTAAGLLWAAKKMRAVRSRGGFDLAFATAVATVVLLSFHSFIHDFSLMILPLLIFGTALTRAKNVPRTATYCIVTAGFLFFLTPAYVWMHGYGTMWLLAILEIATLWMVNRWGMCSGYASVSVAQALMDLKAP